ncbi:MAG: hypothetical protein EHM45_02775 [Desulfobacteraceae bacterium]|nr:MAG: hypothetical protein EHM45_02775 [Desulfobacteraceae bacterium]
MTKAKIECIHFDLDSVLYMPSDFLETTLLMSVKAMIQIGLKARPTEAMAVINRIRSGDSNAKDHFDQLCYHFNKEHDALIVAAGVEKYWDCKIGIMTSAPEANVALNALYQKYPLTLITNGPPIKQAGKIVRLGLSHFFSKYDEQMNVDKHYFYASQERNIQKPYPYLWEQAQKEIGFNFSRAVMVGDRFWQDMFGAKRLGMITIKVNQGNYAAETIEEAFARGWRAEEAYPFFSKLHTTGEVLKLMEPDYTIEHLKDLEKVVQQIERALECEKV